jgi:hypothetical protein
MQLNSDAQVTIPSISGVVTSVRWNEKENCKEVLLNFTMNGEQHQRWFKESELTATEA